jgi:hypothetical protein
VLTLSGSKTGKIQFDQWIARASRVVAREQMTADVRSGFVGIKANYRVDLTSLAPA